MNNDLTPLNLFRIETRDYNINPTSNNSTIALKYDMSDIIIEGYRYYRTLGFRVIYTDSGKFQLALVTNVNDVANIAYIQCLNTTSFLLRIVGMIIKE